MNPIAAIRYIANVVDDDLIDVYFYTEKELVHMRTNTEFRKLNITKNSRHYFEGVPVIEYENNKYRQGDFEKVLYLIDLYDNSQSDSNNYITDFNDALLKIVDYV